MIESEGNLEMRCFVGIPVSGEIADLCVELGRSASDGRPVPRENLHLTLQFLDEQPHDSLEELHMQLDALRHPVFSIRVSGLGQFGQTLHVMVEPSSILQSLHDKVLACVRRSGIRVPHRRFRPHITVARGLKKCPSNDFLKQPITDCTMQVAQFALFSSTLHSSGARYETLADYQLLPGGT
ncbi:2'-5' RNA ligase [Ruegeria lacuscaerulensis ITI-1157]|nr:2'-5' RNA ligase [Ruegeria lacuscaerulensis ITI-1157]